MRAAWYMRHSTSLLGFAVENLPPPPLPLSLSMSYLPHNQAQRDGGRQRTGEERRGEESCSLAGARQPRRAVDHPLHVALRLATGASRTARSGPTHAQHLLGILPPLFASMSGRSYCPGPGILLALYIFHSTSLFGLLVLNFPVAFFFSTGSYWPGPGV